MHLMNIRTRFALPAISASLLALLSVPHAEAQSLIPGDLLISRSTYEGTAATVTIGQALPGGGVAVADGSSLNVFNNEAPDAAFGVTSSIFIDQYNTSSNAVQSTINVTQLAGGNLTTSFPSKSELGLNVSTDGTAVTFMGYIAPKNTLDVSNSNTAVVDPTNNVSSAYQRGVAQLNLDGTLSVTATNAYSGNNGRAAVLAGGNYYMVGNAGNSGSAATLKNSVTASGNSTVTLSSTNGIVAGEAVTGTGIQAGTTVQSVVDATHVVLSKTATANGAAVSLSIGTAPDGTTLSNLSNNTGVQTIAPGSISGNTTVVGAPQGTYGSATGYQNGFSFASVNAGVGDKTGKDDNFRGLTTFNNTLFVTKGSGSNGVNTVYQVGATGSLNGLSANANTTSISILNGFNTGSAKTQGTAAPNPFGLFFANAHTLYVTDEGNGTTGAAAAADGYAGLEKWVNSQLDGSGVWSKAYTLTNGLNIGQSYNVGGIITQTAGLRTLTGRVNGDGTVTLYSVTSTIGSNLVDAGADPNMLVAITDSLGSATGTGESFTTLETAAYGDVLRGVALAPIPEPSAYAAVAGLSVLGVAMIKRRRSLVRA
jgi:hypothetical protein